MDVLSLLVSLQSTSSYVSISVYICIQTVQFGRLRDIGSMLQQKGTKYQNQYSPDNAVKDWETLCK